MSKLRRARDPRRIELTEREVRDAFSQVSHCVKWKGSTVRGEYLWLIKCAWNTRPSYLCQR